jgi:protein tyrosine/serine phosphatase
VKYGVVFRGSDMNWGHTIDSDGISVLKNDLHVGYDMDLRNSAEYSPFLESSPLGSDVAWGNFPVSAYDIENTRSIYYTNALTQIATNLEAGIVTYFHCKAGADRTGTLAFLILGLIGVSESDLNKEYELTAIRNRNVIYSGSAGVESDVNLHTLADSIKVYNGDTLKDKIESWALAKGVTSTNIEKIRQYMIVDD